MLTINEIFYSIQGESTRAGEPCVFVRLTACDLRCTWCDTPYAFTEGHKMSVERVLEEVADIDCQLVEITGGEPLLQADVYPLMDALLAAGKTVMIETGGHIPLDRVPPAVIKVMDVKCPASGESARNRLENLALLTAHDEVKFVIGDRADYEFARDLVRRHDLSSKVNAVLFSPVHGTGVVQALAEWILADHLRVRFHFQVHKFIWGSDRRGV